MFRDRRLYGSRGDPVELISTRGDVAIVQNASGERFSVRIDFLNKSCENCNERAEKRNEVSEIDIKVSNPEKPIRKIKSRPTNQSTLF